MRVFFFLFFLLAQPVWGADISRNPEVEVVLKENRVSAKAGGNYQISQLSENSTVVSGPENYLLQVKSQGDVALVSEAWLQPDKGGSFRLDRNRFTKLRISDGKIERVISCASATVFANMNKLGFAVFQSREFGSQGCATIDATFCSALKRRDSWDWAGGKGETKKLKSLAEVREKVLACQSLSESLAAGAGDKWRRDKTVREAEEAKSQLNDFMTAATNRHFPMKILAPMDRSAPGKEILAREQSPLQAAARSLRQLEDALLICDQFEAQMVPEGQLGEGLPTRKEDSSSSAAD